MSMFDHARNLVGFFENKRWCEEFLANHSNCMGCVYKLPCDKIVLVCLVLMESSGGARDQEEAVDLIVKIVKARSPQEVENIVSSAPEADWPGEDWPADEGDDF